MYFQSFSPTFPASAQVLDMWMTAQLLDSKLLDSALARAKLKKAELMKAAAAAEAEAAAAAEAEAARQVQEQAQAQVRQRDRAPSHRSRDRRASPPRKMQQFTMGARGEDGAMQRFAFELQDEYGSAAGR